jgi:hypothetical protein
MEVVLSNIVLITATTTIAAAATIAAAIITIVVRILIVCVIHRHHNRHPHPSNAHQPKTFQFPQRNQEAKIPGIRPKSLLWLQSQEQQHKSGRVVCEGSHASKTLGTLNGEPVNTSPSLC